MEINKLFPILDNIENNVLTSNIFTVLYNSGYSDDDIAKIKESFPAFLNANLKIDYISIITPKSWTTSIINKLYYFCCHEEKENLQFRV